MVDKPTITLDTSPRIASLRYFAKAAALPDGVQDVCGMALPDTLRAARRVPAQVGPQVGSQTSSQVMLAWRSPTETLLISTDDAAFEATERQWVGATRGCFIDQTGGIVAARLTGPRALDLLLTMGAPTSIPALGEARTGRFAELTVTVIMLEPGEYWLLVERVHVEHLLAWAEAVLRDFQ